ncbi:uncharacterized protein PG986_013085 [Apiospora aurea]|uniref:Uncharacterized protein n=1 Tax=Apiospora aurea TaxID=335848 RepID=A0ABR1Q2I4_9PEZI
MAPDDRLETSQDTRAVTTDHSLPDGIGYVVLCTSQTLPWFVRLMEWKPDTDTGNKKRKKPNDA